MKAVELENSFSLSTRENMTLAAHYGYGILGGIIYSLMTKNKKSTVSGGMFFGLGIWAISYLGLMPSLGFRASGYSMTLPRNSLMIAAHVVWGSTLAYSENLFKSHGNQMLDAHRRAIRAE